MNNLIPIQHHDNGVQAVMGRDLHAFLEVGAEYRHWFPRMVAYGFEEVKDYAVKNDRVQDSLGRQREALNHVISLDMAKEISMIQRTDKGKQARQYFIECEKRAKASPFDPATLTRAEILQIALNAEEERLALEAKNKELEPKAEAYDTFLDASGKYSVGAVAKMLGKGQNWLFRELRNRGVLITKGAMRNTPYSQYMHHFEVLPHNYERKDGTQGTSYTTYVQPSGIDFIRKKLGLQTIDPLPTSYAA
ncbi:phage antirepressor KilAC domain-containing protein [Corynebacterium pseudopelargi]|uniref:Phage antirepressor protein KilAC domain protein n=1 Tax=Corynebacterium pseudopelargi TaxID=2080757 RepID=A0A3G6IX85_9CORY|nr:phage antirepressor KilAC domain-containing protein [Corynebacterium pseudopelargi]AZA08740.1 Phage antirepressor protein KilAC domain protein [Corynebacterium pseudopelargi]